MRRAKSMYVYFIKSWKTSAVSTTVWMVELNFASCVVHQIEKRQLWVRPMGGWNSTLQAAWYVRHAHWARLCYVPFVIWCLWITSTIWLLTLSCTSFMVLPGSTGRFYKDDVVHDHSSHGYYITRMEGGLRYAWYCCYMLNRIQQNWAKTPIHIIRYLVVGSGHISYERLLEWWDEQNRCTYMMYR